jgi:hypothetical protein
MVAEGACGAIPYVFRTNNECNFATLPRAAGTPLDISSLQGKAYPAGCDSVIYYSIIRYKFNFGCSEDC